MSSAIDLRNCPVPAIVPPVPSEGLALDSGQRGDNIGLTGTSDETSDFAVRLPPDFRTGAGEMRIEVAAVLQREGVSDHVLIDVRVARAHLELVCKEAARMRTWFLFFIERCVSVAVAIQHERSTRGGFFDDMWMDVIR